MRVGEKPSACLNCAEDFKLEKEEEVGAGGGRGERGCRFVFIAEVMPFYKVPSPTSTSQPDVKRVRAPLRQSQASSPDPPDESRTPSRFISASGSIQNFEGFSDNEAYVNGRGGGFEGSNPAHRHPVAADMNGSRHHADPPDQQVSIVELEIQQQSEREAELIALRQSLYQQQQTSAHSSVSIEHRTSTAPERTPSSDARSRTTTSTPGVTNHRALSPSHPSSNYSSSTVSSPPPVTYEEAISTRAHPGESLIAREIMELKMREEELKRNRKGMGRVPTDSTSGVVHSNPVHQSVPLHSESSSSSSSSQSFGTHPKHDAVDGDSRQRSRASRIRPPDNPDAEGAKFLPQMETPIEREMRLAVEREDALRQARGLPAVSRADEESTVVEMRLPDVTGPYRGTSASGADQKSDQTMKKLASSRLMVEMEKEKQRELEVRRHNKHPSPHHGNTPAGAAAGHQSNTKSSSYMRKY